MDVYVHPKAQYYVKVDGDRWSPLLRLNDATKCYERACRTYELEKKPHTIQLVYILKEEIVGF